MRALCCLLLALALVGCGAAATPTPTPAPTLVAEAPASATPTAAVTPTVPPTLTPTALPTLTLPPPSPTPTPQPSAFQQEALRPEFAADATAATLPLYTMVLTVELPLGVFSGTQVLELTNLTGQPLSSLLLRSIVNFPPDVMGDGGDTRMDVLSAATLSGAPLALTVEASGTAFRIALPAPLAPGERVAVRTTFSGTLKPWDDGSWPFLSSYPMLATWDPAAGDWRADVTRFPDRVFAEAALFDVTVTLPAALDVVATGSALASGSDGVQATTRFVSGPVREWAATFGAFEALTTTTNGITVNAWQARGQSFDLIRLRDTAALALATFEERFGAYPYRELDLIAMPWEGDAGIEYPGLIYILVGGSVNQRTDFVVDHEVAHQWWYGVVGNDIYREPWIDESLANYSAVVAAEVRLSPQTARTIFAQELYAPYERNRNLGDPPAGLPITGYADFNSYYRAIYGKGAVFLDTLRAEIGDEAFFAGLRGLYASERHGIATRPEVLAAFESAAGRDLDALFARWLGQ